MDAIQAPMRECSEVASLDLALLASLPTAYIEPHWYAAYTCARHEKRVVEQLLERSVEHFLPLYDSVHRWKDRRVRLQLPLFPGYVFVRIPLRDRLRVLQVPGVVRLVGFNGLPTPLPDGDVEGLRNGLVRALHVERHPYLTLGRRVRITNGPLRGIEGILVRKKNRYRVIVSIDLIMRSVSVEIDLVEVERII